MSLAILLVCIVPAVLANSAGPPIASNPNLCTNMIPIGHNGGTSLATDQDNPPYNITTSASEYAAGGTIDVNITGLSSNTFKGFFIQARRADPALDNDVAIGTFSNPPANTQLLMCHSVANSAWAHSSSIDRSTIAARWTAPAQGEGPIEFVATIVKGVPNRSYFYTGVNSEQMSFVAGGVTGMTVPANEGTTQASTTSKGPNHPVSFVLPCLAVMLSVVLAVRQY